MALRRKFGTLLGARPVGYVKYLDLGPSIYAGCRCFPTGVDIYRYLVFTTHVEIA
jgi:hypothetical protein